MDVESEKHAIKRTDNVNLVAVSPNVMSSNDSHHPNGKSVAMQNLINNTNIGITLRTNTHTLQAITHANDIDNDSTIANPSVHNMEHGTKITNVEESLRAGSKIQVQTATLLTTENLNQMTHQLQQSQSSVNGSTPKLSQISHSNRSNRSARSGRNRKSLTRLPNILKRRTSQENTSSDEDLLGYGINQKIKTHNINGNLVPTNNATTGNNANSSEEDDLFDTNDLTFDEKLQINNEVPLNNLTNMTLKLHNSLPIDGVFSVSECQIAPKAYDNRALEVCIHKMTFLFLFFLHLYDLIFVYLVLLCFVFCRFVQE